MVGAHPSISMKGEYKQRLIRRLELECFEVGDLFLPKSNGYLIPPHSTVQRLRYFLLRMEVPTPDTQDGLHHKAALCTPRLNPLQQFACGRAGQRTNHNCWGMVGHDTAWARLALLLLVIYRSVSSLVVRNTALRSKWLIVCLFCALSLCQRAPTIVLRGGDTDCVSSAPVSSVQLG